MKFALHFLLGLMQSHLPETQSLNLSRAWHSARVLQAFPSELVLVAFVVSALLLAGGRSTRPLVSWSVLSESGETSS